MDIIQLAHIALNCGIAFIVIILLVMIPYFLASKEEKELIDQYFKEGGKFLDGDPWE